MSPTQLTLRELRKRGYMAEVVERWNPHAKIRQDLFKIIDVLGVGPLGTVGVQCTTKSNLKSRITKMSDAEAIGPLREANWTLLAHGWFKQAGRWQLQEVDLS